MKLDHAVRTVNQCRTVASGDLAAAVGLLDLQCVAGDPEVVAAVAGSVAGLDAVRAVRCEPGSTAELRVVLGLVPGLDREALDEDGDDRLADSSPAVRGGGV